MAEKHQDALVIQYGTFTFDFNTLPQTSLAAMLRRGVSHFMGSEQASKVTAYFDPDKEEPVEDTQEARKAKLAEFREVAAKALEAGTVGVSTRGPAIDPIESVMRRIAKTQVSAILKANGLGWPKKADDKVNAGGTEYTGAELINRRLANPEHGPAIRKEAEKIVADQRKRAAKAEETAKAEGLGGL